MECPEVKALDDAVAEACGDIRNGDDDAWCRMRDSVLASEHATKALSRIMTYLLARTNIPEERDFQRICSGLQSALVFGMQTGWILHRNFETKKSQ